MSAAQEINTVSKLGILAGGGELPVQILSYCDAHRIEVFVICFHGQTDKSTSEGRNSIWVKLGEAGKVINTLKKNGVTDLVMAGKIKRPNLFDLKPDLKGAQIISHIGLKALGDDGLLGALRKELEHEGFTLHGVSRFSEGLIAPKGPIGTHEPLEEDWLSINHGIKISQAIGDLDIGQSIIIQDGVIIGVEAIEGTDVLIERCKPLLKKGRRAFLVKTCKPNQDKDMDLPTIGPETVSNAHKNGLSGIIIHAQHSIILDIKTVAKEADKYKMFIFGHDI